MKSIFKYILPILFCACALPVGAQQQYAPHVQNMIPPSPTSRIFEKFLGYPISHATGTIDVTIPLYTLTTNGLSIPFTLKYHSSGVRVQDPVGIVGKNWNLFPGFKISRTVMGKPDEVYPVTEVTRNTTTEEYIYMSAPYGNDCDCWNDFGRIFPRMDSQYDLFQINMPGGASSSFILQRVNGVEVVKQISDSPLKITPKLDNVDNFRITRLYGFEVLDDKGIRYVFGEANPVHGEPGLRDYVERQYGGGSFCGWMLREIILPSQQKITFTYRWAVDTMPLFNNAVSVLDHGEKVSYAGCYWDDMVNTVTGSDSPYWRILGQDGYKIVYENEPPHENPNHSLVPATITTPEAVLTFDYLNEKLASLTVKQAAGKQVKKIQFSYDDDATHDLLKKVDLTGEGSYLLNYKNEGRLPRNNAGFDWWGFYNGANHEYTFGIPSITLTVDKKYVSEMRTIGTYINREPSAFMMDTYALIEAISPTKGKLKINYEPHSYKVRNVNKIGGGLRVKSTELYDPASGKTIVKNYTYEDAHFLPQDYPDEKSSVTTRYICPLDDGTCRVRRRTISIFSRHPDVQGYTNPVWYGKVTETAADWKKEYIYNYTPDRYDNPDKDHFAPDSYLNVEWQISQLNRLLYPAPWLVSETSYKKSGSGYEKIQKVNNQYEKYEWAVPAATILPYQFGLYGYSSCQFLKEKGSCRDLTFIDFYGSPVNSYPYTLKTGYHRLKQTDKVTYQSADSLVEKTSYTYDEARPYNISAKTTLCSGGAEQVERYYYSNNAIPNKASLTVAQQNAISQLTVRNYLTTPVQQTLDRNGKRLYGLLRGFKANQATDMVVENEYYQTGNGAYEKRITYGNYDKYGNPFYVSRDNDEEVVYLWGGNGQYPVAEIKGAGYAQVKAALSNNDPVSWMVGTTTPSALTQKMATIDGLRAKLPSALITTCTYDFLIGVTSIMAPNGNRTNFLYNSDNKLHQIKDANNKTVEEYQYHLRP